MQVKDQKEKPLKGGLVTFKVTQGEGWLVEGTYTREYLDYLDLNLNGQWDPGEPGRFSINPPDLRRIELKRTLNISTDSQGLAKATLILGPDPGQNKATATCQDIAGVEIVFVADAVPPNSRPQANNDDYTVVEGAVLTVDADSGVLSNDTDMDENQQLVAILNTGVGNGILSLDSNGSFVYEPNLGFVGKDVFTYVANDGFANSNIAQVTITVTASGYHDDFEVLDLGVVTVGNMLGSFQTHGWGPGAGDISVIVREEYADFGKIVRMEPLNQDAGIGLHFPSTKDGGINLSGATVRFFMLADDLDSGVLFSDMFPSEVEDPLQHSYLRFFVTKRGRKSVFVIKSSDNVPGFGENFEDEFEFPIDQREWYHYEIRFEPTENESEFECYVLVNGRTVIEKRIDIGAMDSKSVYVDFESYRGSSGNSETLFNGILVCVRRSEFDVNSPRLGSIDIVGEYTNSTTVTLKLEAEDNINQYSGVRTFYIDGDVQKPVTAPWPSCNPNNPAHELCDGTILKRYKYTSTNLLSENDDRKWVYVVFADGGCNYSSKRGQDPSKYPGDSIILDTTLPDASINPVQPINLGDTKDIFGTAYDTNFDRYMLQYWQSNTWHDISDKNENIGTTGIENGRLGSWTPNQTGNYSIRLTVWDKADNSKQFDLASVSVNQQPRIIKGDLNGDGRVQSDDVMILLNIVAGLREATELQLYTGDMNGDGKIGVDDAILLLLEAAGFTAPAKEYVTANTSRQTVLSIAKTHGVAGESIKVPLKLENANYLAGGDICVTYDSTVLRAVGVVSDLDKTLVSNLEQPGKVWIAFVDNDRLLSNTIAEVKFEILKDDTSLLVFQDADLYLPDGLPMKLMKTNEEFVSWAIPPEKSNLLQNFPNPFNPETWIPYQLRKGCDVTVRIFSSSGDMIREIRLGYKPAGSYVSYDRAVYWDGRNESDEQVPSGVYFYTIQAGELNITRKMVVAR